MGFWGYADGRPGKVSLPVGAEARRAGIDGLIGAAGTREEQHAEGVKHEDERQYEHVKHSEQQRRRSDERAEEIAAARTVNK